MKKKSRFATRGAAAPGRERECVKRNEERVECNEEQVESSRNKCRERERERVCETKRGTSGVNAGNTRAVTNVLGKGDSLKTR